jgi:hypothetical protein
MKTKLLAIATALVCFAAVGLSACGDDTSSKSKTNETVNAETTIRGISGTAIDSNGHLIISYTDGTSQDVGNVVGSNGKDGTDGNDGTDGTDGQDGSVVTIGSCGHFIIDGNDTYYYAGQSGVIKIDANGSKFTSDTVLPVTFTKVDAVEPVEDIATLALTSEHYTNDDPCYYYDKIEYDDDGNLVEADICVKDVNDMYKIYQTVTTAEDWTKSYVEMLLDLSDDIYFNKSIRVMYQNSDVKKGLYVQQGFSCMVELPDGRQYKVSMTVDSTFSSGEANTTTDFWVQDVIDYLMEDGESFLTNSVAEIPESSQYVGITDTTTRELVFKYIDEETGEYVNAFGFSGFLSMNITVYDTEKYTQNGKLTDDEADLVLGKIFDLIKDKFVVYNLDYYLQKYNQLKTTD